MSQKKPQAGQTHFGYRSIDAEQKADAVGKVFDSVAARYDLMNDLMSAGLHRAWKQFMVAQAALRPGMRVLDIAGGTADIARRLGEQLRGDGELWLTDINAQMLAIGRDRLVDAGIGHAVAQCDAEHLPFPDGHFDVVTVAFGLRNMTHKDNALAEMRRVLRLGGQLLVLEFSRVWKPLEKAYDAYSFGLLPLLGRAVASDADSYRYLAESIRMHPDQETLAQMMRSAGLGRVRYYNLTAGVVALHQGVRVE
jgi:demethylmenaquinone methyltransferase/2-methoxy-6-polyprenyl-1,4-benzoquinol methylase